MKFSNNRKNEIRLKKESVVENLNISLNENSLEQVIIEDKKKE